MASGLLPPQLGAVCPAWVLSVLAQGSHTSPLSRYLYLCITKIKISLFLPYTCWVPSPKPSHSTTASGACWKIHVPIDPDRASRWPMQALAQGHSCVHHGRSLVWTPATGWAAPANCTGGACRQLPLGIWRWRHRPVLVLILKWSSMFPLNSLCPTAEMMNGVVYPTRPWRPQQQVLKPVSAILFSILCSSKGYYNRFLTEPEHVSSTGAIPSTAPGQWAQAWIRTKAMQALGWLLPDLLYKEIYIYTNLFLHMQNCKNK